MLTTISSAARLALRTGQPQARMWRAYSSSWAVEKGTSLILGGFRMQPRQLHSPRHLGHTPLLKAWMASGLAAAMWGVILHVHLQASTSP